MTSDNTKTALPSSFVSTFQTRPHKLEAFVLLPYSIHLTVNCCGPIGIPSLYREAKYSLSECWIVITQIPFFQQKNQKGRVVSASSCLSWKWLHHKPAAPLTLPHSQTRLLLLSVHVLHGATQHQQQALIRPELTQTQYVSRILLGGLDTHRMIFFLISQYNHILLLLKCIRLI